MPFRRTERQIAWNVRHLNAPRAWSELGNLGRGAVVAVLDNGANYAHTDLRANLWRNRKRFPTTVWMTTGTDGWTTFTATTSDP